MGLDTVEIAISFEEALGVEIPDAVAETMQTPRHVIDYIVAQQQAGNTNGCLRMRSFHRLRRALEAEQVIQRRHLKLDTDLKILTQDNDLRTLWKRLRGQHEMRMPNLTRPVWLQWALYLGCIFAPAWIAEAVTDDIGSMVAVFIALCIGSSILSYRITEPLATQWPESKRTPRQLVEHFTISHPKDLVGTGEVLSREQIAETVRKITCEYCNPKDYHEDARFVQDLGLD